MATKKPTPKPAPKPAPKPTPKPAPKPTPKPAPKPVEKNLKGRPTPTPTPTPQPAPLDLVRNPNFDSAMAQQNYANLMRDQQARIAAKLELGGAPLTQSEIDKKYVDDGRGGRVLNAEDAAKLKLQFDQLRANIAANPDPARNFDIDYIEGGQRYAPVNQGPQVGGGIGEYMPVDPNRNAPTLMPIQTGGSMSGGLGDQQGIYDNLQPYASQVGTVPMRRPDQQMQDYQNLLKQGMQRSDTLNQGAMAGFASMQPGMQVPQAGVQVPQPGMRTPQPGIAKPQNPNMAGMGPQQRRQNPAQRKFSTFSNKPARFF